MAPKDEATNGNNLGPPSGGPPDHSDDEQPDLTWLAGQLGPLVQRHGITMDQLMSAIQGGGAGADQDDAEWHDPYDGALTALLQASGDGQLEAVLQLIASRPAEERVAFVNHHGMDGDTALHLASLYGHIHLLQALLQAGANPAVVNCDDGSTAHHDAAASGYRSILATLIQAAPQHINTADEDGDTPLHNAARGNHAELVTLLLQAGADKSIANKSGSLPRDEADDPAVQALLQ